LRQHYAIAASLAIAVGLGAGLAILGIENGKLKSELAFSRTISSTTGSSKTGAGNVLSFLLSPLSRAEGLEKIGIDSAAAVVRFDVALGDAAPDVVDVRLESAGGGQILEQKRARTENIAGGFYVPVWVPATALPPGAYTLEVQGAGLPRLGYAFETSR
jgi:hypothetical protein